MRRQAHLSTKAREHRLRVAFTATLLQWYSQYPDALIVPEFSVSHGGGYADIAVVTHDGIHGIELKTRTDNLGRLESQVQYYNRYFQRSTLVCDRKHVEKAKELLPSCWGLVCADETDTGFVFEEMAIARPNPRQVIASEINLLWRGECIALLDRWQQGHKLKWKSRNLLYARLLEILPETLLRSEIIRILRAREHWRHRTVSNYLAKGMMKSESVANVHRVNTA